MLFTEGMEGNFGCANFVPNGNTDQCPIIPHALLLANHNQSAHTMHVLDSKPFVAGQCGRGRRVC
jgi:hypothetical protein